MDEKPSEKPVVAAGTTAKAAGAEPKGDGHGVMRGERGKPPPRRAAKPKRMALAWDKVPVGAYPRLLVCARCRARPGHAGGKLRVFVAT